MYTVIIITLVIFLNFFIFYKRNNGKDRFIIFIFLGVTAVMSTFFALILSEFYEEKFVQISESKIISINDGTSKNGSFFLGTGTIKDISYYYMYLQSGKGIIQYKVPTNKSVIFEDNDLVNHGILKKYKAYKTCEPSYCISPRKYMHEIYIPKGSFIKQFTFDLQ